MAAFVSVRTANGELRGTKATTAAGTEYAKFLGIPYAAPPTGELRFKPPQPAKPWNGVRDALEEGPICFQDLLANGQSLLGSEDCLYLNVYTTSLPSTASAPKPVMVWIHGGGFTHGSGNGDFYGPDYIVDAGVVVVTINYRIGVLGFLSLDNHDVAGNMGLKDQVASLIWVQQNIAAFGGDPNNVTIFGESAGGASVHYILLSPLSKGLFHKAIAQSGSAINPWAFNPRNTGRAFQLAKLLGCDTSDTKVVLDFLMKTDVASLVANSYKLIPKEENIFGLKFPFVPTIEPASREAFLSEHPLSALKAGRFHHVPFLSGITSHEGILCLKALTASKSGWSLLNSKFEDQLPDTFMSTKELGRKAKEFYFNNKTFSEETFDRLVDFQTDLCFADGVYKTVKQTAALSSKPVYMYIFKFEGTLAFFKQFLNLDHIKGACHADELGYLFKPSIIDVEVVADSPDAKTLRRMIKLWTNFAKTGDPTPVLDEDITVSWKPFTCTNPCVYSIDKNLSMETHTESKRIKSWNDLYQHKL